MSMSRHSTRNLYRQRLLWSALSIALATGGVVDIASAQAEAEKRAFTIAAQSAASALNQFAEQANITLVFSQDAVAGVQVRKIDGSFTTQQALALLLEGTALSWQSIDDHTVSVMRASGDVTDTVVVTGSHIRGGETPSPVISIDAASIREQGFSDLGEVIRSLPQNFNGGQNPGAVSTSASLGDIANGNLTGGSGLNLRGLGPDATLTLLNGRRMAYGGVAQSVDISAIPVEALERIEIVADGASAVYGSDAVAGVGNVILKRDFEGVTVGARYGTSTNDGMTTREYTVTAGTTWSSGGVIATYKNSSIDPIYANQRDYAANLPNPYSLYPGIEQDSGLLSVHQSLGDVVEVRLDAMRTERDQEYDASFTSMYYHYTPTTTTSLVSPTIEFTLPRDWMLSLGGTWGEDETLNYADMVTLATGVSTPVIRAEYVNESRTYELGAEGPLFALKGGDARLAVGAGYRTTSLQLYLPRSGRMSADGEESSRFVYAELNLPLIGPAASGDQGQRLMLTAAMRGEDYDSFGSVTTPKLGFVYGPNADFTFKGSWGKSFKAPTLYQTSGLQYAYLDPPRYYGGAGYPANAALLSTIGGNPELGPEHARTWSASLSFHPEALPDLKAELTWFDIDYTDRVVMPIGNSSEALSNPIYSEFVVLSPTPEQLAAVIVNSIFNNNTGAPYDPANVVAMFFNTYVNAAKQQIRGVDLSASYGLHIGAGRLTVRGSASWLDSSQQTTSAQSSYDLSGSIYNPAKLNARLGAVWNLGGFSASAFANYTGGVEENFWSTGATKKTASFTTVDATLQYRTGEQAGAWSGLEWSLSAQNLFNRDPPLFAYTSVYVPRYDATNASVIGRFLSVSVAKHW
ncbi:TonB-dependent receptor [Peristeroidobacter soli]|uniref:TonB-dependent receptor n=1 Tax=Peristeroidobacter soli TaxID=2497877 RepID=UPI001C3793EF|nr:TonB-dependent receptor [Peristeroidobacter soli]